MSFYAINMDVVSLFAVSSFLFLATLNFINSLYQFECLNIIYICQKNLCYSFKKSLTRL